MASTEITVERQRRVGGMQPYGLHGEQFSFMIVIGPLMTDATSASEFLR